MTTKPKPIPDGFTTVTPHLVLKDSAAAIEYYKKAFGAVEMSHMPGPDGKGVMHAMLKIGTAFIMLGDEPPADQCNPLGPKSAQSLNGSSVALHLYVDNADAVFKRAIDAGGTVVMPPMDMFWGDRYGMLVDPFGHRWSVATHMRDMTPEQMKKEFGEMMAKMGHSAATPGASGPEPTESGFETARKELENLTVAHCEYLKSLI